MLEACFCWWRPGHRGTEANECAAGLRGLKAALTGASQLPAGSQEPLPPRGSAVPPPACVLPLQQVSQQVTAHRTCCASRVCLLFRLQQAGPSVCAHVKHVVNVMICSNSSSPACPGCRACSAAVGSAGEFHLTPTQTLEAPACWQTRLRPWLLHFCVSAHVETCSLGQPLTGKMCGPAYRC